jgi:hypothetical protein
VLIESPHRTQLLLLVWLLLGTTSCQDEQLPVSLWVQQPVHDGSQQHAVCCDPPPPPANCPHIRPTQHSIYEKIGKGKHSTVYKGRKKKTIQYHAIKSVDKSQKPRVLQEVRACELCWGVLWC